MSSAPRCMKCKNYYVTWDRKFPKGCRLFEIKSTMLPSQLVFRSTGKHCPSFEPK